MKRLSLFLLLMFSLAAGAQEAKIKWLEQVHDFGAFDENNGNVSCRMRFVNVGDIPVSVISARATCGCTTPSYPRRPVEPGDTATIEIAYNPTGRPGRFDKKVYIETNTRPAKTTLIVKGVVIGSSNTLRSRFPVEAGPLKLKNSMVPFGEVTKGRNKAAFLDIYNTTADTLHPQFTNLPPYLSAKIADDCIAPGDYGSFAITLNSDGVEQYGLFTDKITFVPDPAFASDSVIIDVVAMLNEDFSRLTPGQRKNAPVVSVYPDGIDLGIVDRDSAPVVKTLEIKNLGKEPLVIRRIYTADKGVEISCPQTVVKKGKSVQATLTIIPSKADSEMLDARIQIITNAPDRPVIPLRVVSEVRN